jgi:uroporphyrinogen-III decarboxylase
MNPKERVLAAIRRKAVDRVPTTFRANKMLAERLLRHFGFQAPADFARHRQEFLGRLGAAFWSSGTKIDRFSAFTPKYLGPPPQAPYVDDGTSFYKIGIHARAERMPACDLSYAVPGVDPPLGGVSTASDIPKGFLMGRLEQFDFASMVNPYREVPPAQAAEGPDNLVSVGTLSSVFMICCYLRGMEAFLLDLAADHRLAAHLVGEVGEFVTEFNRRELEAMHGLAEYYGTWDDVAGQEGLLFSPRLFSELFLPVYRELIDNAHRHGLAFGWHCCGSVHEALPAMIDAGIDVFDVVQTSARDMRLELLHRRYASQVCFHGGVDVQRDLVGASPEGIRAIVRRIRELWGGRGGFILAPSHEALPDTPLENLLALYEEAARPA